MPKAMLITIGTGEGVENGIAFSIEANNPDFIYFLGTKESQATIGKVKEKLSGRLSLQPEFLEVKDKDDIESCYLDTRQAIIELLGRGYTLNDIYVDFTSGTKAMSAGVALGATSLECKALVYVTGKRERGGGGRVISGTERLMVLSPVEFLVDSRRREIERLFNACQFDACLEIIKEIREKTQDREIQEEFELLKNLVYAYLYWDRFDHKRSVEHFAKTPRNVQGKWSIDTSRNKGFVNKLVHKIGVGEIPDKYSEEQLADLFANAARRAKEGKFDDAVARLYRAVELLSQFFLARKGIDAGDVNIERLPVNLREKYNRMKDTKGKVKIAQERGYTLLEEMGEELGQVFLNNKRLRNALKSRNDSILAHGLIPISSDDYKRLAEEVTNLAFVFLPALEKLKTEAKFAHLKLS